jgi:DNA-binding transcriptional MerR regulator
MGVKSYTIGELARLSGQTVRRVRFYSDKGLLPPSLRSASNYRIYTDTDVARLDLIRALREAGVGLEAIRGLLARQLSLHALLSARLDILEAEIAAKRRTAAVLRATLRVPDPAHDDLRRIWTMSKLNNQQMRPLVESFVERISAGATLGEDWRQRMVEASVPELPENPTPEQIAAWDELAVMLADEGFAREFQGDMQAFWTGALDPAAYQAAAMTTYEAARQAVVSGLSPESAEARRIARTWLDESARAMGREPDRAFVDWHITQYEKSTGRTGRYREFLTVLRGESITTAEHQAWGWLNRALMAISTPG